MNTIDLRTPEGRQAWLSALPTANLRAIVARRTVPDSAINTEAFILEATAEAILIAREAQAGIDPAGAGYIDTNPDRF